MTERKLGQAQKSCLESLENSFSGSWTYGGHNGWVWDTPSGTNRTLESLARRGLVLATQRPGGYATFYAKGNSEREEPRPTNAVFASDNVFGHCCCSPAHIRGNPNVQVPDGTKCFGCSKGIKGVKI